MAEIQVIDPLEIATMGMISISPITIATNGFIVFITEDIIDVPISPPKDGFAGGGMAKWPSGPTKKKKKRITATVVIGGEEYTETIELDDITLTAKDVHVEVVDGVKPQLKLTVIKRPQ